MLAGFGAEITVQDTDAGRAEYGAMILADLERLLERRT